MKIINRQHEGRLRERGATGHNHTYYSLNDAVQSPKEYVNRCKELGFESVALNDHGTLLGVYPFMDACKAAGVNGIPGVEAYSKICPEVMERLSQYEKYLSRRTHLIVNPKTYHGYQLVSYAMRDANMHQEKLLKTLVYPIMTCEILEEKFTGSDEVFATSACVSGAVSYILLLNERIKHAMAKEEKKCADNEEQYKEYVDLNEKYEVAKKELSDCKKELTKYQKFLKPEHEEKIRKKKEKLETLSPEKKSFEKTRNELETAVAMLKEAQEKVPILQELVSKKEPSVSELKTEVASAKKAANVYLKAKAIIDTYQFLPEEELYECAKIQLLYYKKIFRQFFVEIQYHGYDDEAYVAPILVRLADETGTKIIAANDAHVTMNTDEAFETRRIMRYNYFQKAEEMSEGDREMYVKSDWELVDALAMVIPEQRAEEAVRNTDVFHECHVVFPDEKHYPSVKTEFSFDELLEQARQKKIDAGEWNDIYEQRFHYEIGIIKSMGYVDYHMVVMDFCNEARRLGAIPKDQIGYAMSLSDDFDAVHRWMDENGYTSGVGVGPGRGSAAGSLVCFLLGITNIDPVRYGLLFERFLNPERVSMPDIDSDIKTSIRPLLIRYLQWKYGEKSVCSIATESTYAARGSVKMAGRERASQLYDKLYPEDEAKPYRQRYLYDITEPVCKIVPEKPGIKLSECDKDFEDAYGDNEEAKIIWEHAKMIEGKISGTGIHAAGVIISDNDNINDYIALAWNEKQGVWVAQCDMIKSEEIGLLKMDLLGLETLDTISDTIELVKKYKGIDIDINNIGFEPEVFAEIYAKGDTNNVFQFESAGMKSMLKDFKPTCIEDLIILVACYRPGPMQYLSDIIEVKNGRKALTYKTPELESILSDTYGAVVYQEQVMEIFRKLAGYSLGGADMVRRAMSKKKLEKLEIERTAFIDGDEKRNIAGCKKNGISAGIANKLFDEMIDFAKYAFNKSHAAAYAVVSYQTGWCKYHYPLEFLCGLFNNKDNSVYEGLYSDCTSYGFTVYPPSINESYYEFVEEDGNIRYGFKGIKDLGAASMETCKQITQIRAEGGPYTSMTDFLRRNVRMENGKVVCPDKKELETLIKSGVFDCFGHNRFELAGAVMALRDRIKDLTESETETMAFIIDHFEVPKVPKDISSNIAEEQYYLGSILSENPLNKYKGDDMYGCTPMSDIQPGKQVSIFGFVVSAELKKSMKGNNMIILNVQGKTGSMTVMAMNALYDEYAGNLDLLEHQVLKITGSVNDGGTMFARSIKNLAPKTEEYFIDLPTEESTRYMMWLRSRELPTNEVRNVKATVQVHWMKRGTELVKRLPSLVEMSFSDNELDRIKKNGISVCLWNGETQSK